MLDAKTKAIRIDTLPLSVRTRNTLKSLNIETVGEAAKCSAADLLRIPNFGRGSLKELDQMMSDLSEGQPVRIAEPKRSTTARGELALKMKEDGLPLSSIATNLGVSVTRVGQIIAKAVSQRARRESFEAIYEPSIAHYPVANPFVSELERRARALNDREANLREYDKRLAKRHQDIETAKRELVAMRIEVRDASNIPVRCLASSMDMPDGRIVWSGDIIRLDRMMADKVVSSGWGELVK